MIRGIARPSRIMRICRIRRPRSRCKRIRALLARGLDVRQQPGLHPVQHGQQDLVLALEVPVDPGGDQADAPGHGGHAQPAQPAVGHQAQGRLGDLLAADFGIQFLVAHGRTSECLPQSASIVIIDSQYTPDKGVS